MGFAIKAISSKQSVEEVLNFYRNAWKTDTDIPGYVENTITDWQVISQLSDTHNLVVQLKSMGNGYTDGFISSMALKANTISTFTDVPLPPNAAAVSHTQTKDKDKTGYTSVLVTPSSIGSAAGHYRDHLEREGWSLASDEFIHESHVLKFNKRLSSFEVVISAAIDGTTVILLNRTASND
jgi:hypothetical protein